MENEKIELNDGSEGTVNAKNRVDLTGVWFVNFAVKGVFEGSRILTLTGMFEKEQLLETFCSYIYDSLPDDIKSLAEKDKLMIRQFNRIGD